MEMVCRVGASLMVVAGLVACVDQRIDTLRDPTATAREALQRPPPPQASPPAAAAPGTSATAQQAAIRGFVRRRSNPPGAVTAPDAAPRAGEDEISLDFVNADLESVIQVIMEEGLGASYLLAPGVSGTVTLKTNRPLRRAEILPTLEEILRLNNAAMIERDGIIRIVPRAEAGLSAPFITAGQAANRGLTVRVTPLRFVTVDDVREVLDGFAPVAGAIRYDRSRNLVFTVGTAAEQTTILNVLATLDANYFATRSFALQPLRNADPEPVVDELTEIFAPRFGEQSTAIRFVPITRMRAVLFVADDQELLDDALALTRNLDQGMGEQATLHIFPVQNRRAADLATVIGDIFDARVSGVAAEADPLAPGLTAETDELDAQQGATGTARFRGPRASANELSDTDFNADRRPDFADAPDPFAVELAVEAELGPSALAGPGGVLRVTADEASNTIVALATADGARAVENALRRLDVQPLQVMIEATLVEVALTDTLEFGVRYFIEEGDASFSFGDIVGGVPAVGLTDIFPGFNAAFRTANAAVTISALDAVTDVKILSSPTLMVLDSQTARLQVGDQVPITTRSSQSVIGDAAPIVTEEEFRDTGVILEIRPTVSAGGLVVLEVRQEVSDVLAIAGAANPSFSQRVVESTIAVQSGETIALAGLIEEDADLGREGLPFLSRLPLVGAAFGSTAASAERSELLVLIRPIVIRDQTEARAATAELGRKLQAITTEPEEGLEQRIADSVLNP